MKIMLAAPELHPDDLGSNQRQMLATMEQAAREGADLLLFGEASLPGFDALSFDYAKDIRKVLSLHSPEIAVMQEAACHHAVAVAFGFFENHLGGIYSSYLILDQQGRVADLYRRVSPGWKEARACADYREGLSFHSFSLSDRKLSGRKFATLICGDLWEDKLLSAICALDAEVDAFFWPVHVDIAVKDWEENNTDYSAADNISCSAYAHQSSLLAKPVLFINNYLSDPGRAKGGLYHWEKGRTVAHKPMGRPDFLMTEL